MKTNEELQKDVQDAIKWEPLLMAAEIGVTAKDGVVSLTGTVNSYRKKVEAQDATKNVAGVHVVIEDIKIKLDGFGTRNDSDIAFNVIEAFKLNPAIPNDVITVEVEDGWVTLGGEVRMYFQKHAALQAIKHLTEIKGLSDCMEVRADLTGEIEEKEIERAIERNWSTKNRGIKVFAKDHDITLTGNVNSYYQKDEAQRIAYNAPGVRAVNNELVVEYDYSYVY